MPETSLLLSLACCALAGMMLGGLANWAIYAWAWQPRPLSPWSIPPAGCPARSWRDRIPLVGWWRIRRDAAVLGRRFWVRPLLLEVAWGLLVPFLYWWEVDQAGLITGMEVGFNDAGPVTLAAAAPGFVPPAIPLLGIFATHVLLVLLMWIGSFIDIDEKIIPDEVTVLGTLAGLILVVICPWTMLPAVSELPAAPLSSSCVRTPAGDCASGPSGGTLQLTPVTAVAPLDWPAPLAPLSGAAALAAALGCFWLWCFALTPRIWRSSRGVLFALAIIARRVVRELTRGPLAVILPSGTLLITVTWWWGAPPFDRLLSALLGLVLSGGLVWAVRIIGTAALRREAMGFGDVTLMMMIGTYLGWQACLLVFFLAPFAGIVVGVIGMVLRRDDEIPYGPYLCLAALLVMVRWADFWNWMLPLLEIGGLIPIMVAACLMLLGVVLAIWRGIKSLLWGRG